jgi:hypothetical protein
MTEPTRHLLLNGLFESTTDIGHWWLSELNELAKLGYVEFRLIESNPFERGRYEAKLTEEGLCQQELERAMDAL